MATPLFTRPFVLLCATMFVGYGNQWVITPVIPLYVDAMGGSAFVAGLALLAFSVPSVVVRPLVGRMADRHNAALVLAAGLCLLAAGSALLLVPLLAMVFVSGLVRGCGWSGFNTGGYTTLAGTAPAERRGEAAGWYTSATASASMIFPALALWIVEGGGGFQAAFLVSAVMPLAALPFALALARQSPAAKPAAHAGADPGWAGLIDRGVLVATGINLCTTLVMPSVMAFMPLYARSLGIEHIGVFYILAGITSILIRPILGKKSDAMGRGPALAMGLGAQLIGLLLIFAARDLTLILVGGVLVSVGFAMIGATATALAMDLANPVSRGRGMATFSLSYQLGAGIGAIISGAIADLAGLRGMYAAWKLLPRPGRESRSS